MLTPYTDEETCGGAYPFVSDLDAYIWHRKTTERFPLCASLNWENPQVFVVNGEQWEQFLELLDDDPTEEVVMIEWPEGYGDQRLVGCRTYPFATYNPNAASIREFH